VSNHFIITLNKIECLKQNIKLMNIQAWDNAEGMSSDISREGLKGTIGVIQKITGEVKFHDRYKMHESESISLNWVH